MFITIGDLSGQNLDSQRVAISRLDNPLIRASALMNLGKEMEPKSLDSAIYYYSQVLDLVKGPDTLIASCYSNLGNVLLLKGDFAASAEYNFKARALLEHYPENPVNLKVVNCLGLLYFYQNDYQQALDYFQKADGLVSQYYGSQPLMEAERRGRIYNNIGIIYDNISEFDQALEYYARASTHSKKSNDLQTLASIYSNMGIIYMKTDRFGLAESILKEAYEIRISLDDTHGLCKSFYHLGAIYRKIGQMELAQQYLDSGIYYCQSVGSMPATASIMNELSSLYADNENFESAYKTHLEFKALSDSLFQIEVQEKMAKAELQFNYEKEQQEAEAEQNRNRLMIIIIVIVLIFITAITVIMFFLQKSKARNQLLAKEKALFEKESIELSNKELSLRKLNLENELEFKNKELTTNVMYLLKKNELLNEIMDRLIDLKKGMKKINHRAVERIIKDLQSAQDEDVWEEFEVRFSQVYNDFYERLNERFPNLTPSEKKLCAFLRLNMSSKEICALTRQSYNSLNVARARLRKKLNLNQRDINLISFLESI
ncbi:MAG: tetratricopeptide repeat protein [Marinoscillum sp.]